MIIRRDYFNSIFISYFNLYFSAHTTTVEYVIDQPMEFIDEGLYICNVSSTSGFELGDINIDVLGKSMRRRKKFFFY
jgi:hypothetical protein